MRKCYPEAAIISMRVGLRTAANQSFDAIGRCKLNFSIDDRNFTHEFLVVRQLVTDVILGTDFLSAQNASLHFTFPSGTASSGCVVRWPERATERATESAPECVASEDFYATEEAVDEDAVVPFFGASGDVYQPPAVPQQYERLLQRYNELFRRRPGSTDLVYHHIPTGESAPARLPARRIPML